MARIVAKYTQRHPPAVSSLGDFQLSQSELQAPLSLLLCTFERLLLRGQPYFRLMDVGSNFVVDFLAKDDRDLNGEFEID